MFENYVLWKFEDECKYVHIELIDSSVEEEASYWKQKKQEKFDQRDEFYKQFKDLLPPSKLKELEKEEQAQPKKQSLI